MSKTISESVADPRGETPKQEIKLHESDKRLARKWASEAIALLKAELKR